MAGIYIHIPFCKTRCVYCDFFSSTSTKRKEAYTDALCRELALRKDYLNGEAIATVYFGGGTPSQLHAKDFNRIFRTIEEWFLYPPPEKLLPEITLEANPDDIDRAYLESLRGLPFNRISLGVQSLKDRDLSFLKRRHDADKAIRAVACCRDAGFENISIDLIYGLPGQTPDDWMYTLEQALRLNVRHISAYHLIYEAGTALYRLLEAGEIHPADEETSVELFNRTIDVLTAAGFIHYEISGFGQPGYFSRHNTSYWTGKHYLGIGASAHSFNGISRQWNISSIEDYLRDISQGIVPAEIEQIDSRLAYNDYILTGLRTMWGIDLAYIQSVFGEKVQADCIRRAQKYLQHGTLVQEGDTLRLSRKGIFLSDGIMSDLLIVRP
ncbi:MAG: radical SAM family heme chaperone HemW [Dysgonamonadaceae bacterium]|jgi:oxygen-independent coproporphyrinogen-3 oxidase|nr:radical SAM family heme chaperone HemW [Dysgonamonadaceae bacterium]